MNTLRSTFALAALLALAACGGGGGGGQAMPQAKDFTAQVGDIANSGNDTSEPISLDMGPALDSSDTADPVPVS